MAESHRRAFGQGLVVETLEPTESRLHSRRSTLPQGALDEDTPDADQQMRLGSGSTGVSLSSPRQRSGGPATPLSCASSAPLQPEDWLDGECGAVLMIRRSSSGGQDPGSGRDPSSGRRQPPRQLSPAALQAEASESHSPRSPGSVCTSLLKVEDWVETPRAAAVLQPPQGEPVKLLELAPADSGRVDTNPHSAGSQSITVCMNPAQFVMDGTAPRNGGGDGAGLAAPPEASPPAGAGAPAPCVAAPAPAAAPPAAPRAPPPSPAPVEGGASPAAAPATRCASAAPVPPTIVKAPATAAAPAPAAPPAAAVSPAAALRAAARDAAPPLSVPAPAPPPAEAPAPAAAGWGSPRPVPNGACSAPLSTAERPHTAGAWALPGWRVTAVSAQHRAPRSPRRPRRPLTPRAVAWGELDERIAADLSVAAVWPHLGVRLSEPVRPRLSSASAVSLPCTWCPRMGGLPEVPRRRSRSRQHPAPTRGPRPSPARLSARQSPPRPPQSAGERTAMRGARHSAHHPRPSAHRRLDSGKAVQRGACACPSRSDGAVLVRRT
eukprot:TRINITY_DN3076_c0_g1_i1.p1 TRINITY_DN3076_c0_g1~~TRINITY_DN3076_c0_g1_i1.p1  ORF type:complete len:577 (+),score=56.36 TRINITY_DN3076_c0_g1_i1:82-1731(+)